MKPISFLHSVAQAVIDRYEDLTDICFLFPNKRSSTFFLKALADSLGERTILAPEAMSIEEFMTRLSGRETASRIDLIFRLYNVYRKLLSREPDLSSKEGLVDFDHFAPWAEVVINDFSDVDKFDAEADAIFANVRDLRSIESNFLTEEQQEILERYFGYRPSIGEAQGFWKTIGAPEDFTDLKEKFIELWRLLPELYDGLRAELDAAGLATQGLAFRLAKDRVAEHGREALPWQRICVVGFNMLSVSEVKLFKELQKMRADDDTPFADFFWDATGPVLDPAVNSKSLAAEAIGRNIRNFPMPGWATPYLERSRHTEMPDDITVVASPSNAAQTKIAMRRVSEWLEGSDAEAVQSPATAIVLPNENMLLPLIHSFPAALEHINLTMGYSIRYTAVASFVYHLKRINGRRRKTQDGRSALYHEDLRIFMSHPFVHLAVGTATINRLTTRIGSEHLRDVPLDMLAEDAPLLAEMLAPVAPNSTPEQTIFHIDGILSIVDGLLARQGDAAGSSINSRMERSMITHYRQALFILLDAIRQHEIVMRPQGVFHLADRLPAGEKVTFEGEPLEGLQIMGLLETRALDFDRLIVLSMNDKEMPKRSRTRTYIPESLRHAYGLPLSTQGEELSAYYFYRLLSRAKEVVLIYDARAGEGMRSGGKSRFLMQLEMLYAKGKIKTDVWSFNLSSRKQEEVRIEKDENVMKLLSEFTEPSGRNMSASALMNYCACPAKFYFKDVVHLNDNPEPVDYLDAITLGNVMHEAMLNLYLPEPLQRRYLTDRVVLSAEKLQEIYDDDRRLERVLIRAINKKHFNLQNEDLDRPLITSLEMTLPHLTHMVRRVIKQDIQDAPIELVGGEISGNTRVKMGKAPEINFAFAIDRIDVAHKQMRIIDYKTGTAGSRANDFDQAFSGERNSKYLVQLLTYAMLLNSYLEDTGASEAERALAADVAMFLYKAQEDKVAEQASLGKKGNNFKAIDGYSEVREGFSEHLERILCEIFDPEVPFSVTNDTDHCEHCPFTALCGR